jgi:hypothetical protein
MNNKGGLKDEYRILNSLLASDAPEEQKTEARNLFENLKSTHAAAKDENDPLYMEAFGSFYEVVMRGSYLVPPSRREQFEKDAEVYRKQIDALARLRAFEAGW